MTTIQANIPYPPSVNRYWRSLVVGGRARVVISRAGREFRERVQMHMIAARAVPMDGPVQVTMLVYRPARRGDLDNTAKAILDALQGHAYHDDSQIVMLHMERFDDKEDPRVEIRVTSVDAQASGR